MEDDRYAYPDPATRRRTMMVAIVIGIGVLAVGLVLVGIVRPWLDDYLRGLEELAKHDLASAKRSMLNLIALVLVSSSAVAIGCGIWIVYEGRRMARAEQWPSPGMKVYRRVKILDGTSARRRGRVLIAVGLILAFLMPVLGWKMYRDISTLFDAPRSNNHAARQK